LFGDLAGWKRARTSWSLRESGCFAANRDRGVHFFKHKIIAALKSFKTTRCNISNTSSAFSNYDRATSAATLCQIQRASDLRKRCWFEHCTVSHLWLACTFDAAFASKREQLEKATISH
jgi:hypothetical protein